MCGRGIICGGEGEGEETKKAFVMVDSLQAKRIIKISRLGWAGLGVKEELAHSFMIKNTLSSLVWWWLLPKILQ